MYKIFRRTGYALSISGLCLFVFGGPTSPQLKGAGCLAMAAGFFCIFITYGIYMVSKRSK